MGGYKVSCIIKFPSVDEKHLSYKIAQENLSPLVQTGLVNSMCSSVTFVKHNTFGMRCIYFWFVKIKLNGGKQFDKLKSCFCTLFTLKRKGDLLFSLQMLTRHL